MKYLFLILLCYGVKCKSVGNNYFVVQMPEDNMKELKKPFQVYWNVPTMQCASKKIPFQNLYEKYGIIQNDNDRFIGDKIVIIYNEIDFPAIIHNKTSGKDILRNGGVPQEGDLEKHLIAFENELKVKIPDPYFDGIGIIDFESWQPVFRQNFGSLIPHRHLSIEIEKKLHNWWPKMWIEREASLRFEAAARRFMQTTLSMVKEMRPNALWGYYGFPYCFNMRGRDMAEKCAKDTNTENDSIYWLWAESTALFPSLYSSVSLTSSQLSSLIKGRVKETSRVRGKDTPFFPYFWFKYRDDAEYITEKDIQVALNTLYESNASGFIIWGSSNDVNTVEKCTNLLHYVETVLGPNIAKYTKRIKRTHSDSLQNKDIYLKETSKDIDNQSTQIFNTDEISTEISTEYTDESSQTLNDEIFSTESYTYSDDSSDKMDVSLSLTESATEYMNTNQHIPALNIKISQTETNTDTHFTPKNLIILVNDEQFTPSPETVTDDVYITDQSSQTSNDKSKEETTEFSTIHDEFNRDLTTLNGETSSLESFSIYSDYMDTDKHTETLNNQEMSTTVIQSDIKESIIINNTLFSSPPQITADYSESTERSSQILNNDEISVTEMSTSNNIFNEETTVYSEYSVNDENIQILNINDLKSLLNKYTNEEQSITMSSTDSSTVYSEFTSRNEKPLSMMKILSKGQHSTYIIVNDKQTTESLNNVENLKETSASDDVTHTDKTDIINEITEKSKFGKTGEDFSNNMSVNSKETSPASDKVTFNDKSTDIINEIITENNKLGSTGEDFSYNMFVNSKVTSPASDKVTFTDKTDIINEIIENSKFGETGEDFSNNMSVNSNPGSDYLIIADNSANIETIKQYEHPDFDEDNDYIIIIKNLINNDIFKNITDKETTETDKFETVTNSEKDLDTIVNYEQFDYNINEVLSNEDESHQVLPDSNENDSDYLIIADNYTNIESNHSEHTDDDYLIIVRDINQENVKENTDKSTTERNLKDFDDSDLIVAYINKVGNVKLGEIVSNK